MTDGIGRIFGGIGQVFLISAGEVMCAREVFLGTHVDVVVLGIVQHGIYPARGGDAYGAGRKAGVEVGVVGRGRFEVGIGDALPCEVAEGETHGRVGLQRYTPAQAVDVEAGHDGLFRAVVRFFFHNGGQCTDLVHRQPGGLGFGEPFFVPEAGVFLDHALQEAVHADVPVHLVGVGDEKGVDGGFVVAQLAQAQRVVQGLGYFGGVYHELATYVGGQPVHAAHAADGEVQRCLLAPIQPVEHVVGIVARLDGISPCADVLPVVAQLGHPLETGKA